MIIVLDTETGGLNPQVHSLLEVGMVAYHEGEIVHEMSFLVKHELFAVTAEAMNVNKINLNDCEERGHTPSLAVELIKGFISGVSAEEKPMLLGHNVDFDRRFLMRLFELEGQNLDDVCSHRTLDTAGIIRFLKDAGLLPQAFPGSLHKAARAFGYEPKDEHRALGDIYTTIFVYEQLMNLVKGGSVGGRQTDA